MVGCVGVAAPTGAVVAVHEPPDGAETVRRAESAPAALAVQTANAACPPPVQFAPGKRVTDPLQVAPVTAPHVHAVQSRESLSPA